MKTQYYTATSLDGFIATEDDSIDWLLSLGTQGESSYPEFIAGIGALAMGASTYEWMMRHSAKVIKETGSAWPYEQPTWVFTYRKLATFAPHADIRFVRGDVRPVHAEMRKSSQVPGTYLLSSGMNLDGTLLIHVVNSRWSVRTEGPLFFPE